MVSEESVADGGEGGMGENMSPAAKAQSGSCHFCGAQLTVARSFDLVRQSPRSVVVDSIRRRFFLEGAYVALLHFAPE